MNKPPSDGIRVPAAALHQLVHQIFQAVPVADRQAALIAKLLIDADLRGIVSHGVMQVKRYFTDFRSGATNTHPEVQILREAASTAALSGDGGLGYGIGTRAMEMAIDKARETGVGAVTTTYHEHIGSAGNYARMAMRQDMIGICFSGHSFRGFAPGQTVNESADAAPLAFGIPAGPDHPYFLCDFSSNIPFDEDFFAKHPEVYFRGIGFSYVGNIMSGTQGGQMLAEFDQSSVRYPVANQSGFFMALAIENFVSVEAFKGDMDEMMAGVSQLEPYPGFSKPQLPGGPEWNCERQYEGIGLPVCREAQENLEKIAGEVNVDLPW